MLDSNRFNASVFITPPWEDIYIDDEERDQTFEDAVHTYNRLYEWYNSMGYTPKVLPKASVAARVHFILKEINLR